MSALVSLLLLSITTYAAGNVTFNNLNAQTSVMVQSGQGWDKTLVLISCDHDLRPSQFYMELQSLDQNPNSRLIDVIGSLDDDSFISNITFKYQISEHGSVTERSVIYTPDLKCGLSGYGKWNEVR